MSAMKKILLRVYGLLLCTAMCIGAVSCTRDEEVPKMEASELDDFTTYDGNVMTATPEGYYVIQKDFKVGGIQFHTQLMVYGWIYSVDS